MKRATTTLLCATALLLLAACTTPRGPAGPPTGGRADSPAPVSARMSETVLPETFELANVVLSLTEYTRKNPYSVWRSGAYYQDVAAHFDRFRGHPLVRQLDAALAGDSGWVSYYGFRENSVSYAFDGDELVRNPAFPAEVWESGNPFRDNLPLIADFARATGFRAFFAAHRAYYADQVDRYAALVPVEDAWKWLEDRFPARYQRYRVVISPLIYGSHSTDRFDSPLGRETLMFVSGPDVGEEAPELRASTLMRIVFTEIDHNYVNPATDLHRDQVDTVFNTPGWASRSEVAYGTGVRTFNEYMTWAVFLLYAREKYDAGSYSAVEADVKRTMEVGRGFTRFTRFADHLLGSYRPSAGSPVAIPSLYPEVLTWAKSAQPDA